MFEPLCFLHVADADLDRPVLDIGPLSPASKQMAHEATLTAFDRMIDGAIARNADFVLFAGNTFCEADQSLPARLRLLRGLDKLHEHEIAVFVLPGEIDPVSAWRKIPNLPSNVTVLAAEEADAEDSQAPVAVLREGRVIATITAGTLAQLSRGTDSKTNADRVASTNGQARQTPFRVGLLTHWPSESTDEIAVAEKFSACDCDYLAVPVGDGEARRRGWTFDAGQTINTNAGIAHHPGRLQARFPNETGAHGATLIEVDKAGEIRGTFLPFAAVRRLEFLLPIKPGTDVEDLAKVMHSRLAEETAQPGEQAWLVTWILEGSGPVLEFLKQASQQTKLSEKLPSSPSDDPAVAIEHRFRFLEFSISSAQTNNGSELERLYQKGLEQFGANEAGLLKTLSEEIQADIRQLENPDWQARLMPIVAELDPQEIQASARELGHEWFGEVVKEPTDK